MESTEDNKDYYLVKDVVKMTSKGRSVVIWWIKKGWIKAEKDGPKIYLINKKSLDEFLQKFSWYSVRDLAEILGLSIDMVRYLIRHGRLKAEMVKNGYRVSSEFLREFQEREGSVYCYSVKETAEVSEVDYATVLNWIKEGLLAAKKHGRQYRIKKEDLERFLKKHNPENCISALEAANRMGVSWATITRYIRFGWLNAQKRGRKYFIREEDLEEFMATHKKGQRPQSAYYSVKEAAARSGVTKQTIYVWIRSGLIEAEKEGRDYRVKRKSLNTFLSSKQTRKKMKSLTIKPAVPKLQQIGQWREDCQFAVPGFLEINSVYGNDVLLILCCRNPEIVDQGNFPLLKGMARLQDLSYSSGEFLETEMCDHCKYKKRRENK